MTGYLLDTHAAVWYVTDAKELSAAAAERLDNALASGHPLWLASISVVEMVYLVEKGRIPRAFCERIVQVLNDGEGALSLVPLDMTVLACLEQVPRQQVPDMPDRIIAASAWAKGVPLVTCDARLQGLSLQTVW